MGHATSTPCDNLPLAVTLRCTAAQAASRVWMPTAMALLSRQTDKKERDETDVQDGHDHDHDHGRPPLLRSALCSAAAGLHRARNRT